MAERYKVLKISKMVGLNYNTVGPSSQELESIEFAKINAKVVEVSDENKNVVITEAQDADIILLSSVPITRWIIEASPKCLAIMAQSVGFDNIDVNAATENNIIIVNNPSFEWCIEEVSNHAMALLFACAKKLKILDSFVTKGRWAESKNVQTPMGSIYGQILGIVGCGAIGRMAARKAHCFGLKVLGYDPYVEKYLAKENGITLVTLPELLKESDYISLHPDLNESSHHMIGEKEFNQMKFSVYLINTSRGKVVDERALVKALESKRIAGAGLDVFEKEPIEKENPLVLMNNVILLPHSASYSDEAFRKAPINIVKEAGRILNGQWPINVVNKSVEPRVKLTREN